MCFGIHIHVRQSENSKASVGIVMQDECVQSSTVTLTNR